MNMLIGSRALKYWMGDFFSISEQSDWDIIYDNEHEKSVLSKASNKIEFHDINLLNNRDAVSLFSTSEYVKISGIDVNVCSLQGLAAIKRSHLWRDYNWNKHINDWIFNLAKHYDKKYDDFTNERSRLTKKLYKEINPNLNQSNEDFFDDFVSKKFDHDWIHEIVAYYDKPLYTRLKYDENRNLAKCEKDLWNELSYEDKLKCVAEETQVIALERFIIPNGYKPIYARAYHDALKKVCTTLASGWFRDFAIDNFVEISKLYDRNRIKKLSKKIEELDNDIF